MAKKKNPTTKSVEALMHDEAKRKNIPTAEYQSVLQKAEQNPVRVAYERRNRDLDPQLVWRGKDEQDWSDLVVHAPPLYIQEKVHPKALIDDLLRETREREYEAGWTTPDLFADFNGIPKGVDKTEFYQHDQNWSNRMILGDSLQVMASLAEREGLRGKVQCIYLDPPYGIKFNSNFQWSTTSRDVKDGKADHITREPEQVKAFRDTWRDGIHSYLTYLRDRLTVARDLLTDSGSIFVQIGDENVHRVRAMMDEVFGEGNCVSEIAFAKTTGLTTNFLSSRFDFLLWYAKSKVSLKFRRPYITKSHEDGTADTYSWIRNDAGEYRALSRGEKEAMQVPEGYHLYKPDNITSQGNPFVDFEFESGRYSFRSKTPPHGLARLARAGRIHKAKNSVQYVRNLDDFALIQVSQLWNDTGTGSFTDDKLYVVQTGIKTIQRCILMATDPGDLVLDPTCGSGTTATVAEQWGRRWITIDTSRVALALARARIMGARYPFYLLADTREGQIKEAEVTRTAPSSQPTHGNIRHGFVYERVPHITLKSIANNTEIDVIWDEWQTKLEPLREKLNAALKQTWQEWEIPREADAKWPEAAKKLHADWWQARIARQQEIDKSIAAKAEFEYLYDKPYEDKKKVRVAGPFTVESLSPHRVLGVDENDELIDTLKETSPGYGEKQTFPQMILENLKTAGVQQAHKEDRITFTALTPWPGDLVCAEGRYLEIVGADLSALDGNAAAEVRMNSHLQESQHTVEKRAAIFIGPEFGTVTRPDLVAAAREAGDADFDVLIACAFNYEAHATEFNKLGRIPVLKARMNADLHMADDLKNTGKGNLFVIFGEPDITILPAEDGKVRVKVNGVDVFHPNTGEVRSDGPDGIACWFIDTDYNEESFFVRHAYFLGANDPYSALKTTLKAEINEEAWATLHSDTSRAFPKPKSGRIAVKVINHLGDEVMKVFRVG
ncbi:MAG: site-specific DNA-methyltransferase [Candidatus Manganitrophaceae bacterium]